MKPTPSREFREKTNLLPKVIAVGALARVRKALGPNDQATLCMRDIRWFQAHCDKRARWVHANQPEMRIKFETTRFAGRDWLVNFTYHWAMAFVKDPAGYRDKHLDSALV